MLSCFWKYIKCRPYLEMGIVYDVNERHFLERTKFFVNDSVVQNKQTNDLDRSVKWKTLVFLNELRKTTNDLNSFKRSLRNEFSERWIYLNKRNNFFKRMKKKQRNVSFARKMKERNEKKRTHPSLVQLYKCGITIAISINELINKKCIEDFSPHILSKKGELSLKEIKPSHTRGLVLWGWSVLQKSILQNKHIFFFLSSTLKCFFFLSFPHP